MKDLSLRAPVSLAIAEGATTPAAANGALAWSTATSRVMQFNGTSWHALRATHVGTTAPSNPQVGDVWIDETSTPGGGGGGGGTTVIAVAPTGPEQLNWAPAGFTTTGTFLIRMQPTGPLWLSGLTAGGAGQEVTLYNDSAFAIGLLHDLSSTAANRFSNRRKTNWMLPRESVNLIYDATISRWTIVGDTYDMLDVNPSMNLIVAAGATTPSLYNVAVTNTATVTAIAANTTPTDDFIEQLAMQATNATAAGTSGTFATSGLFARGATTGRGGIAMVGQARFPALGATGGVMAGLTSSTAVITAQPSTLTNCILLGANGGQTTLRICSGNAAAGTPVDLGANFPVPSATAAYEYFFHLPGNSTVGYYLVRRLDSHFVAAGSVAASPVNTTLVGPRSTIMVGATAAASTIQYTYMTTRRLFR